MPNLDKQIIGLFENDSRKCLKGLPYIGLSNFIDGFICLYNLLFFPKFCRNEG